MRDQDEISMTIVVNHTGADEEAPFGVENACMLCLSAPAELQACGMVSCASSEGERLPAGVCRASSLLAPAPLFQPNHPAYPTQR
jgi:hypothetical protein